MERLWRMIDAVERGWWAAQRFVIGDECPFCKAHVWWWLHDCPAMKGKTPAQIVESVSAQVRETLQDEPADAFVHSAYEAMERLEKAFPLGGGGKADG